MEENSLENILKIAYYLTDLGTIVILQSLIAPVTIASRRGIDKVFVDYGHIGLFLLGNSNNLSQDRLRLFLVEVTLRCASRRGSLEADLDDWHTFHNGLFLNEIYVVVLVIDLGLGCGGCC